MTPPYLLYETASFHGGSAATLEAVIDRLAQQQYGGPRGIKFHPIAAAALANPDFYAFGIYEELQLDASLWADLIDQASHALEVWLEMADHNCVDLLVANRGKVAGVKFQASMIENAEVLSRLPEAEPAGLRCILNVSGLSLSAIENCLDRFAGHGIDRRNIFLQMGFQGYPTSIEDTMLNKIAVIERAFPNHKLSFADHVDATDPFAAIVPALAAALGCSLIEKHICLDRTDARYDRYSALEPDEMEALSRTLEKTSAAFSTQFVGTAEARYLRESILQPCLVGPLEAGRLVSSADLLFRRQGSTVLDLASIKAEQARGRVLAHDHAAREGLTEKSYRDAKVAVVVACRMKSTRLKKKPLLPVNGKPALERCLENCLLFPRASSVVLATSLHPDDAVLEDFTLSGQVGFFKGDPDDVLKRYLGVADRDGIDVIVRVTADNPVISPEIAGLLLDSHFASGADFTRAIIDAVGTGCHIINVQAMRRVQELLGEAPLSEYMNWYFENNPDLFKVNTVTLPDALVRDYRLTLDYPADLELFERLFAVLDSKGLPATTANVFSVLDGDPEMAAINRGQTIVYQTDTVLIDRLKRETRITLRT